MSERITLDIPCAVCNARAAQFTLPAPDSAPQLLSKLDPFMRTVATPLMQRMLGMLRDWQRAGGQMERDFPPLISRALDVRCADHACIAVIDSAAAAELVSSAHG